MLVVIMIRPRKMLDQTMNICSVIEWLNIWSVCQWQHLNKSTDFLSKNTRYLQIISTQKVKVKQFGNIFQQDTATKKNLLLNPKQAIIDVCSKMDFCTKNFSVQIVKPSKKNCCKQIQQSNKKLCRKKTKIETTTFQLTFHIFTKKKNCILLILCKKKNECPPHSTQKKFVISSSFCAKKKNECHPHSTQKKFVISSSFCTKKKNMNVPLIHTYLAITAVLKICQKKFVSQYCHIFSKKKLRNLLLIPQKNYVHTETLTQKKICEKLQKLQYSNLGVFVNSNNLLNFLNKLGEFTV